MSDPVSLISSMATRPILEDLAARLGQTTGRQLQVVSVGGVDAARRVRAGEAFDIIVLAADALASLVEDGLVQRQTVRVFARSPTAVAVRAGVVKPEVCDVASIRTLVSETQRIALSSGPSGRGIAQVLAAWGVPTTGTGKVVQAPPGVPVAQLLARGDAEIGFQQLSELLGQPGIEIVGVVPEAMVAMTTFSCGIGSKTADVDGARQVLSWLCAADAHASLKRFGMEPGA